MMEIIFVSGYNVDWIGWINVDGIVVKIFVTLDFNTVSLLIGVC